MADIILTTLNARYIHSAFGLRYLKANMAELASATHIEEFVIDTRPIDIVERLLSLNPRIVGLGIYIWNTRQSAELVALLKSVAPQITVVLGGPEVSHEWERQAIVTDADYLITGAADAAFCQLCRRLLDHRPPPQKVIHAPPVPLNTLKLPYTLYSDDDIAHRVIYVEASRGCPFKCEFCLSALDKTALPFDIDMFLAEMDSLLQRGARHFKFVDRTFNLNTAIGVRILSFFLARMDPDLFLHFEVIPDRLPDKLKAVIARFPPGSLQFEIGIQSFSPEVQALISRRQDNAQTKANLTWLREHSHAHLHTDLIAGLPGEDLASFARGFDQLAALNPHEIQVGILKRLRGTPILRHTDVYQMRYNPYPPYNILSTRDMNFHTLQRLNRFARYWDMVANSGRFGHSKALLLGDSPFERFMTFSDWLYRATAQTHKIALKRLFQLVYRGLTEHLGVLRDDAEAALQRDYAQSGLKGAAPFSATATNAVNATAITPSKSKTASRQTRHLSDPPASPPNAVDARPTTRQRLPNRMK